MLPFHTIQVDSTIEKAKTGLFQFPDWTTELGILFHDIRELVQREKLGSEIDLYDDKVDHPFLGVMVLRCSPAVAQRIRELPRSACYKLVSVTLGGANLAQKVVVKPAS